LTVAVAVAVAVKLDSQKRMMCKGLDVLQSDVLKAYYIESRDMDFDPSVLDQVRPGRCM
jgi:hypothetical protein